MDLIASIAGIFGAIAPHAADARWLLVIGLALAPLVGMALTITAVFGESSQGFFTAICTVAYDTSYPTGGETADFSAILPNRVVAGARVGGTLNDEGMVPILIPTATTYLSSTPVIQCYWYDYDAVADGLAVEVANTTNLSAANGQIWMIWGD